MFNPETPLHNNEFNKFRKLIYEIAGISLSDRKRELVKSRLARRLRFYDFASYSEYYDLLCDARAGKDELEHFVNALTTNKTEFFREGHHFDHLRNELFPRLRQATLSGREKKLRIWCAAASTGQEPYTLAMTMMDYFGSQTDWDLRLLASDIDTQVLATASEGVYPEGEMDGITSSMRTKYFLKETRGNDPTWRVKPELKSLITYRQLNLIEPNWPIHTLFDAIFCRNVMIYFDQATQIRLVDRFSEYLHPGGLLFIGHSESLFSISDKFESLGDTIYQMKSGIVPKLKNVAVSTPNKPVQVTPRPAQTPAPKSKAIDKQSTSAPAKRPTTRLSNSESTQQHLARVPGIDSSEGSLLPTKVLVVGEYEASREESILQTVLGSCVAACLYDPTNHLGGMNHFMLPEANDNDNACAIYGVHAMELLINALMKLGGSRRHMIAKIFGGASVVDGLSHHADVGRRNVEFVKQFLNTENIPIVAEHVLGEHGRRVKLIPTTGRVFVSLLNRLESSNAEREERAGSRLNLQIAQTTPSVTMFQN